SQQRLQLLLDREPLGRRCAKIRGADAAAVSGNLGQMAQSWAKEQQGRAEHGAGRKKAFVLRLTGPEIEDGKASLAAYRAQHFVNQHDAGRARSELRIISRKY